MEEKKKKIIEANIKYFDRLSSTYSKKRREKFGKDYAYRIVLQYEKVLSGNFPKADVLLDMGCGVGKIMLNLKLGGVANKIYGIDISHGMLKECISNSNKLGISAHLLQGDVESLPFFNSSFDMVIGHAFLHHIPDVEKVFSEVYRVLKPGGICIFTEPSKVGSRITLTIQRIIWLLPWLIIKAIRKSDHINIELHTFTPYDLENLALKNGFTDVFTRPYAGFISRIFYWVVDPIAQLIPFPPFLWIIDSVTRFLYVLDDKFFKKFIPKGWYDEIAVVAQKEA